MVPRLHLSIADFSTKCITECLNPAQTVVDWWPDRCLFYCFTIKGFGCNTSTAERHIQGDVTDEVTFGLCLLLWVYFLRSSSTHLNNYIFVNLYWHFPVIFPCHHINLNCSWTKLLTAVTIKKNESVRIHYYVLVMFLSTIGYRFFRHSWKSTGERCQNWCCAVPMPLPVYWKSTQLAHIFISHRVNDISFLNLNKFTNEKKNSLSFI